MSTAVLLLAGLAGACFGGAIGSWLTWRAVRPALASAIDAATEVEHELAECRRELKTCEQGRQS